MVLAFALVLVAFSLLFLHRYLGPAFWRFDPFLPEEDIWED